MARVLEPRNQADEFVTHALLHVRWLTIQDFHIVINAQNFRRQSDQNHAYGSASNEKEISHGKMSWQAPLRLLRRGAVGFIGSCHSKKTRPGGNVSEGRDSEFPPISTLVLPVATSHTIRLAGTRHYKKRQE